MVAVDCVLDAKAGTGESAVWDDREQVVWWVDIDVGAIHRFDQQTGFAVVAGQVFAGVLLDHMLEHQAGGQRDR